MVTTRKQAEDSPRPSSPPTTENETPSSTRGQKWMHAPPVVVTAWLAISVPLVIWDTAYCLLRPHSMPGGKWHGPWIPYALYSTVDYVYGWPSYNSGNGFTSGQAFLNLVETVLYIFYLVVVSKYGRTDVRPKRFSRKADEKGLVWFLTQPKVVQGRIGSAALVVVFSSFVMTLSKTVLYWVCELFSGFENIGHNDLPTLITLWILPNGLWIVFPALSIYYLGNDILNALDAAGGARSASRKSI